MREVARTASHFPDALVRLSPDFLEVRDQRPLQRPGRLAGGETGAARDVKGVEHFAIDVELELLDRPVADLDRSRAFVARQPGNFIFLKPSLARDAVDNLQVVWRASHCAQEPFVPRLRLVEKASPDQRIKGERRVPKPAVSIIPIARAAQLFGQRRRAGGDNAASSPSARAPSTSKVSEERRRPSVPAA